MKKLICFLMLLTFTACTTVHRLPDGTTTVRTFGASTVTVTPEGGMSTTSPGISEGFASFLREIPEAVLRVLGGMAGGIARAAEQSNDQNTSGG